MNEVTLEKIDIIKDRTNVSYADAKKALETCNCNVVDALIYLENNNISTKEELFTSVEDFFDFIKDLIKKGNIHRIKIKKEDHVIADVPVNAGIATGILGVIYPPIIGVIGVGAIAGVFAKLEVEITKEDGSVEVVNNRIKNKTENIKERVSNIADDIKSKYEEYKIKNDEKRDTNVYRYTVEFIDVDNDNS